MHTQHTLSARMCAGRSLGGAVAIDLAASMGPPSRAGVIGLIVENSFCSVGKMALHLFPLLKARRACPSRARLPPCAVLRGEGQKGGRRGVALDGREAPGIRIEGQE